MNQGLAGRASRSGWGERAAWIVAVAAVALVLALVRYESRDPDSALHAAIASDIANRPLREWIVPQWNGLWSLEGLYREHPAGVFLLPAVAIRLGYPSLQASYAVNALYQVLTLFLMMALARHFVTRRDARLLATLMLFVPIAFTYRVRANQEQPLLMFLLMALLATERSRTALRWAAVSACGFAGLFLIKGVFAAVALVACAAWIVVRQWRWPEGRPSWRPWVGLAIAGISVLGLAGAYDAAYSGVAGERFIPWYWGRQFGVTLAAGTGCPVIGALYSFAWYLSRIAWYSAPWTAAALIGCWRGVRGLGRRTSRAAVAGRSRSAQAGAALAAAVAVIYLVAFSVFERRADRYIFPAYFFLAAWWAGYTLRIAPSLRRLAWRAARVFYPCEQAVIWFCLVLLAMGAASLNLPSIKLWP